jgi:hypothetical protein
MSELQIVLNPTDLVRRIKSSKKNMLYVDVDEWVLSLNKDPILTWGASPCLVVIIHDMYDNIGAVAHINIRSVKALSNGVQIESELYKYYLYEKVYNVIKIIFDQLSPNNIQMLLCAGRGFHGRAVRDNHEVSDLIPYLKNKLRNFLNIDIFDYRYSLKRILYGTVVYEVMDNGGTGIANLFSDGCQRVGNPLSELQSVTKYEGPFFQRRQDYTTNRYTGLFASRRIPNIKSRINL